MKKKEFLDLLKQALESEVDQNTIEQSMIFYSEYISSQPGKSEEEVIKEIGDPRLIAKTIIDTEKISEGETGYKKDYRNYGSEEFNDNYEGHHYKRPYGRIFRLRWYHAVILALLFLTILSMIIRIGWIVLRLLYTFFIPIVLVGLLWVMFRRRD